ncbi:MAG: zinc ribbon domain-containing protein [Planctomycetota bacterium]
MPTYEYYCPANRKTLEVMHAMSRTVSTWGELCELADAKPGKTATSEPVEKLLSAGMVVTGDKQVPESGGGSCCGAGGCGSC